MYVAMQELAGRWHLESSSENTQGGNKEWIIEVMLAEFSLVGFVSSRVVWCTQSTELRQDALQLRTYRLICLKSSG